MQFMLQFSLNNMEILNSLAGGGGIYVQVQFTEQPQNKNEVQDMLDFYRPYKLNQISVNKMSIYHEGGSVLMDNLKGKDYEVGTCSAYGAYIVLTDGSVVGCCDEVHIYPKLRDKIPNIFETSLEECKKQSDFLYLNDATFINYCKNCSLYDFFDLNATAKKSINNGYLEISSKVQTRYFVVPEYLSSIPEDVLLFMYENNMVSAIKNFKKGLSHGTDVN
ncbi:SPASM domain-containing protein [Helicobacter turcicus]|uniref:SPASM domain-containing protein n=1 Tax=Helicobacter turcicus TaxID=2867412 RepID=A0ABS7JQC9_9HELI|nr:SPASM domain-containing protein [Helicobacter turcicus]MBX7491562.1 SPASM domain-containing protein [Helicobacter turcicus]